MPPRAGEKEKMFAVCAQTNLLLFPLFSHSKILVQEEEKGGRRGGEEEGGEAVSASAVSTRAVQ